MPENFDHLDGADAAVGGQEDAGESDERFRDRYRKAQAAIKKIRQQEGKKRKQDGTLARIIVQFLSDPRFTRFFLLISRIVAKNIPSDIILAILALIHRESAAAIEEKALNMPAEDFLPEGDDSEFPPHLKAHINRWLKNILAVGTAEPHEALETLVDHNWTLDPNVPELASAVLQQFFLFQKVDIPAVENLFAFTEGFFQLLLTRLEKQVHEQVALVGDRDEDFEE